MIRHRTQIAWFVWGLAAVLLGSGLTCAPRSETPPSTTASARKDLEQIPYQPGSPGAASVVEQRITAALTEVENRELTLKHGFWTVFHGILGLGLDLELRKDPHSREKVKAIDLIASGEGLDGLSFIERPGGTLDVLTVPGSGKTQGHQDQFVAEMVQWGIAKDRKFKLKDKSFTFMDLVRESKARASVKATPPQELSWAILIIAQYYGTDHKWRNLFNEDITLEDIVRYEIEQPIKTAACGGTHRLFGLSWALHMHCKNGGKIEGVWKDAYDHTNKYKAKAQEYRNGDGSFSTDYVSGPASAREIDRRLGTTGHVLEWLALALTDEEIRQGWVEEAANALALMILEQSGSFGGRDSPIDGGSLYHATHGLYMYRQRVFGVPGPAGLLIPPTPKVGR